MCGTIPSCFAPLDDRGDQTNHMKSASLVETPAMPRIFFVYVKQGKLGSSIQLTNVLKPEPIHTFPQHFR